MPLFTRGAGRTVVSRLATNDWKDDAEKAEMLDGLQKHGSVKPLDVLELVWHRDAQVRAAAAAVFTAKAGSKAISALLEELEGQPSHHRGHAMRMMGKMPPEKVEKAVESYIRHTETGKQKLGWEAALGMTGPARRRYLERAVKEAPGSLRMNALQSLLKESSAKQLQGLLLGLTKDEDPKLRTKAVEELSTLHSEAIFAAMVERFQNDNANVRELASAYLREYAEAEPEIVRRKVLAMLAEGDPATRRLSVEILMETGEPRQVLQDILEFSRGLTGWLRKRILETLRTFGDDMLRPAVELLTHDDEEIRSSALVLAEEFQDPRLVGPLCKLLTHEDWWLRICACELLAKLGDERAVPHLVKALADPDSRWAALDALGTMGSKAAIKPITKLLGDKRQEVRLEAVHALGHFDDKRVVGLLQKVTSRDPSLEVRTRASEVARDIATRLKMEDSPQAVELAADQSKLQKPIDRFLAQIREQGASDLHLSPGEPAMVRKNGKLSRMEMKPLDLKRLEGILDAILDERQKAVFEETGDLDFCYAIPEVGRYRANAYNTRLGASISFRVIPNMPPTFSGLRIPSQLQEILDYHQGIILVSGPAGSGKSTTLAALVNLINEARSSHVITLEDPVEFVHPIKQALVNQREVGTHTASFSRALRGALREDPDVIVVGELRDAETARKSMEAAETGHLVIATMPTTSAVATIDRLVGSFPPEEQMQVRMALSETLKFVVSQSLIPRADGDGRVAVFEIIKCTLGVGALIRDAKTFNIPSMMQIGSRHGMQTVDMALEELVDSGLIAAEAAYLRAEKPESFESRCSRQFLKELAH